MQESKVVEEALQIAEERSKRQCRKGKIHPTLNAEFQRIAKDKKANEQCKETEESNRMGKTRSCQEDWRYQGIFHAKMGRIKDRNGKDLTEAEEIKKMWQEYTEELYKKRF